MNPVNPVKESLKDEALTETNSCLPCSTPTLDVHIYDS